MLFLWLPFLGSQLDARRVQQSFSTLLGRNSNISHPWWLLGYSLSSQPTHAYFLPGLVESCPVDARLSIWQKTQRTPLYSRLEPFLCTARSSAIHCPEKSSHLGSPELQPLFPLSDESSAFCWGSTMLWCNLESAAGEKSQGWCEILFSRITSSSSVLSSA